MKKSLLTVGLSLLMWGSSLAAPALRGFQKVTQRDGTSLVVYLNGDERFSYYSTSDGVVLLPNDKGDYCYAQLNEMGELVATGQLAHEAMLRSDDEVTLIKSNALTHASLAMMNTRSVSAQTSRAIGSQNSALIKAIGSPRIPLILIQYSDLAFTVEDPKDFFNLHCNGVDYANARYTGSIRDYFADQSNNQFTPFFDVIGPVTLDNTMAYYGQNNSSGGDLRCIEMIQHAIEKAKAQGVDFSVYDIYEEDKIPVVYTIYAGFGENVVGADPNTIWPKQGTMNYTVEGKTVTGFGCSNELMTYRGETVPEGIGVFCHEFSHCLGLPDFYNTNSATDIFGMSSWSVMDYGLFFNGGYTPIGYTSYEREFMGWITSNVLDQPTSVELASLADSHKAFRIVNDANSSEYYLLENRQPSKWFPATMGSGMMVLHVDYSVASWNSNTVNNVKSRQRMTLIPADGSLVKENDPNVTQDDYRGDFYPGITQQDKLTDDSTPSAATVNTGGFMGKPITHIVEKEGVVSFDFMGGDPNSVGRVEENEEEAIVDVYTLQGKLIARKVERGEKLKTILPAGLYLIKGVKHTEKIIVE